MIDPKEFLLIDRENLDLVSGFVFDFFFLLFSRENEPRK